jgi:hypothetical protein
VVIVLNLVSNTRATRRTDPSMLLHAVAVILLLGAALFGG